jgi:hypothetical protein
LNESTVSLPATATAPNTRVARALGLGAWALIADTALSVLILAINQITISSSITTFDTWNQFATVLGIIGDIAITALFTHAALQVAAASTETTRSLAQGAAALFVIGFLVGLGSTVVWMTKTEFAFLEGRVFLVFNYALFYGKWGLLLAALVRASKAWGFRFPLSLLVAALSASIASMVAGVYWRDQFDLPYEERLGVWFAYFRSALSYSSTLVLAAVFFLCRAGLSSAAATGATAQPRRVSDPEWLAASNGLALYRGALLARIAVTLVGVPGMMLVAQSGNMESVKVLLVMLTVVTLVCGLASIIGLFGYASVPESSGARAPARTALGIGLAGGVFDFWALLLVIRLAGGSLSEAFAYQDQAPWVEAGAQATGLVALMFLISSFHFAASALGAHELANTATSVGWMLGITGFLTMLVKLIATTARGAAPLAILAIPAVLVLLVGVVRFVSLVGSLARVMREGPPEPADASQAPVS